MIKVIEAISDSNVGGAGVLLVNRLRHTDRERFDTTAVLPEGSALKKRFSDIGIKTVEISACRDRSFSVRGVIGYVKIFRAERPNIVNAHGCLSARVAAFITRVPLRLYTRHCVYPIKKIYRSSIVRATFGCFSNILSHGIIAVAHSAKENLVKMGIKESKIKVIINGAEGLERRPDAENRALRKRLGIGEESFVSVICARLEECKDHDTFLNAAALVCREQGEYIFLIIGGGSRELELKDRARALGIEDRVIFTGFLEDISPYMNISDLNVNCSVGTETSSLALSEGMSLGIPCVVSDYGGNPYMVRDGENGFIYKARDAAALAQKIKLIADMKRLEPSKYALLSQNSRERYLSELNALAMTVKTQKYYIDMLKKYRPRK